MNVFAAATWPHQTSGGEPSVDGTFGRHNDNLASFGCRGHGINRYSYTGIILQQHNTKQSMVIEEEGFIIIIYLYF